MEALFSRNYPVDGIGDDIGFEEEKSMSTASSAETTVNAPLE